MEKKYKLSHRWIVKNEDKMYPQYFAYDIYSDKKVIISKSLFYILLFFKHDVLSIDELYDCLCGVRNKRDVREVRHSLWSVVQPLALPSSLAIFMRYTQPGFGIFAETKKRSNKRQMQLRNYRIFFLLPFSLILQIPHLYLLFFAHFLKDKYPRRNYDSTLLIL